MTYKPIFCCDFDGVIHSYTTLNSPWDSTFIPDPPVPGAFDFLREMIKYSRVMIYSSRSHQDGGIQAMKEWMLSHARKDQDESWMTQVEWPSFKPSALVTLDDRAVCFRGTFPDPLVILTFKPWNRS